MKVVIEGFLWIRYVHRVLFDKTVEQILKKVRSSNCLHNYTSRLHHGLGETENTFSIPHLDAQHNTANPYDLTLE